MQICLSEIGQIGHLTYLRSICLVQERDVENTTGDLNVPFLTFVLSFYKKSVLLFKGSKGQTTLLNLAQWVPQISITKMVIKSTSYSISKINVIQAKLYRLYKIKASQKLCFLRQISNKNNFLRNKVQSA